MQSGHVESFIGRLRDECLNARWSRTLADAREKISRWREEYNNITGSAPPAVWAIARPTSSPKR
jgi:transposase InsO family protein